MVSGENNHNLAASMVDDPQRLINEERFIQEVKMLPVIWNTTIANDNTHKVDKAWRNICQLTWSEFYLWSRDVKSTKCLELRKDWRRLRGSFLKEYCRRQQNQGRRENFPQYDSLTFLIPTITNDKETESSEKNKLRAAKRARTDPSPVKCSCGHDNEEDQKFLQSLLSHMQDVPKASKLALRCDILQLIAKYTKNPSKTR